MADQTAQPRFQWLRAHAFAATFSFITVSMLLMMGLILWVQIDNDNYHPLSDLSMTFIEDQARPLDPVHLRLQGCTSEDAGAFMFGLWIREDHPSHLGPGSGAELAEGCYDREVSVTLPELVAGPWQFSLLVYVTDGRDTQPVSIISDPILVVP